MSRFTLTILTTAPEQTEELGRALGAIAREGDILALAGPLGAGKTCLVRGLASAMGVDPAQVSSPTFVVMVEHQGPTGRVLVHADAYRLSGPDDLDSIGWERVADGSAVVVVEWAERLGAALGDPAFVTRLRLTPIGAAARRIDLDAPAAWALRREWGALEALAEREAPCPICGKPVTPVASDRPFCSPRCRDADLGRWLSGQYAIPDRGEDERGAGESGDGQV